jgi:ketosteroid isomerase-like protein
LRRLLSTMGLVLPLLASAADAGAGGQDPAAQLLEADRRFAAAVAEDGLAGWLAAMAEDAVRLPELGEAGVQGKAAIAELDRPLFAATDRRLVWEPTDAGLFADGRHGYTTGRYRVLQEVEGAEVELSAGAYATWWRREGETWRVIFDTGAPD